MEHITNHYAGNTMSIVFNFDKPEHPPPPRALVHEKRAKDKLTPYDNLEQLIDDNQPVPHDKEYASLLTGNEFKCKMIRYISNKLVEKCTLDGQTTSVSFIIDSPSLQGILHITQGSKHEHNGAK